jgi:hypothetical protein
VARKPSNDLIPVDVVHFNPLGARADRGQDAIWRPRLLQCLPDWFG